MYKKIAVSALLVALAFPLSAAFAHAEETQTEQDVTKTAASQQQQKKQELEAQRELKKQELAAQKEQKKQELEALKLKNQQDRCKNIEARVDTRINRYENNLKMFQTVFGNMETRLTRLSTRLEEALKTAGITDTSKLDKLATDMATLKTKIQKLDSDYAAFITGLKDAKTTTETCDPAATTGLSGKFGEARKTIDLIRQDRQDIRNFFETTIRPDLLAIRAQLPAEIETADSDETKQPKQKVEKVKNETTTTSTTTGTTASQQ